MPAIATRPDLPELPLREWRSTKETLHRWVQIVGKVRMASSPPRNHWWHATLYVDIRGLTTRRLPAGSGGAFRIDFDFVDHRLVVATDRGDRESFALEDGLSVAAFDEALHATLARLGVDVAIRETPYGLASATPFTADTEHASYDRDAVERFWRILAWADGVLQEFAGWYCGKTSPVHFFWHGFDLAHTRFGRRAPSSPDADPVAAEAYSHEVVSFGFWPGDDDGPEPSFYAYTTPEPAALRERALRPDEASWQERPGGSLALLPYDAVRTSRDPRLAVLAFYESVYRAGASALGWDVHELRSSWCPSPAELDELLGTGSARGGEGAA
jgi:Family of unknown function (DUF5996)